ncbi:O-antigen ligase family protein [Faunimonas sp. B44]|uniref:O-antigen ligase family protein n=1 Tax=Faunimonas sp. B44 TaxID=3461493 RepID=UPI004043DEDF
MADRDLLRERGTPLPEVEAAARRLGWMVAVAAGVTLSAPLFLSGPALGAVGALGPTVLLALIGLRRMSVLAIRWPAAGLILAYLLWLWASHFWSDPLRPGAVLEQFGKGVNIVAFIAAYALLRAERPGLVARAERVFAAIAAALGAAAIVRFLLVPDDTFRLHGFGAAWNSVLAGISFGAAVVIVAARAIGERTGIATTLLSAAACAVLIAAVVLSGSRGPLVGLALALAIIMLGSLRRARLPALAVAAAVGVGMLAFVGLDDLPARGLSHRPELWKQALAYAESHPLFGYGAGTRLSFSLPGDLQLHMPHNVFLSALLQGGAVAAGLLAALCAALLLAAWRARSGPDRIALPLLVFGLVCGMVDRKVELASLSVEYLTLWYSAALLLGAAAEARSRRIGRSGS